MRELLGVLVRTVVLAGVITGTALMVRNERPRQLEAVRPLARLDRAIQRPIESEARVYRATALPLDADNLPRRSAAHPRTLKMFHALRPYPGAPPRIPHGLTAEEYRTTQCRTCHERGGYVLRFEAYAPVTPHPELVDCQQCHLASDELIGTVMPTNKADALCRQCHSPAAERVTVATNWRAAEWTQLAIGQSFAPPPIPHDLQMRSDCRACHAGPGAVEEIRTTHGDRGNCRQCHVLSGEVP